MLGILEKKKIKVNYLFNNLKNFFIFWNIMSEEKDLPTKRKYQMLLWGQILLVTTYI